MASALRDLVPNLMQGGPAPSGMGSYQTAARPNAQTQQIANVLGGMPISTPIVHPPKQ